MVVRVSYIPDLLSGIMYRLTSDKITILDGGMGRELEKIGAPFRTPEWSALALIQSPEMVKEVHNNFIKAGADIITTNTYALVPFHIGQERFDKDAFKLALLAAQIARECAKDSVKVAGCIPPPFGSYQPELFLPDSAEMVLSPLIKAQEDYVDFWLIETMSAVHEATTITNLVRQHSDLPIWVAFTVVKGSDGKPTLRSEESLDAITPLLEGLDAVLLNCGAPEDMCPAINVLRSCHETIPVGVYANAFSDQKREHASNEKITQLRQDITPESYNAHAEKWVESGASIIGGCCGIGADHIKALAKYFK